MSVTKAFQVGLFSSIRLIFFPKITIMDYGNNLARQLLHVYVVFGIDFMSGVTAPSAAEAPGCGGHGVGEGVRRRPAKTRKFLFQHLPWAPRKGSHL